MNNSQTINIWSFISTNSFSKFKKKLSIPSEIVSILTFPPCSKKTKDKTENHDKDNDVT